MELRNKACSSLKGTFKLRKVGGMFGVFILERGSRRDLRGRCVHERAEVVGSISHLPPSSISLLLSLSIFISSICLFELVVFVYLIILLFIL